MNRSRHLPINRPELLLLALILALGLWLRLYKLGDIPFGFHTDEGHNALDAWRIADEGWRPAFLHRNNGREPLYMYLMAGLMALFGPSIWSARLAGAICGGAMILVQWLWVRDLGLYRTPAMQRRMALLSAGLLAVNFWPVAQARYALRANLLPVFVGLMLWAWWRGVRTELETEEPEDSAGMQEQRRVFWLWPVLTGVFLALAFHTHMTGRLLPAILIGHALWLYWRYRRPWPVKALFIAGVTSLILALPQLLYFKSNPELAGYRAAQVSIFSPEVNDGNLLKALAENALGLFQMLFIKGDSSWYHNLGSQPIFPAGEMFEFYGLLLGIWLFFTWLISPWHQRGKRRADTSAIEKAFGKQKQDLMVLILLTLAVTSAPSLLSTGAPNYVRLTGIWPALFLVPALGLNYAIRWISDHRDEQIKKWPEYGVNRKPRISSSQYQGFFLAVAIFSPAYLTLIDYFGSYARADEVYASFNAAAVERGQQLAGLADQGRVYASPALWQQSVIRFLNLETPPRKVDLKEGLVIPGSDGGLQDTIYAFDPVEVEAGDADAFAARWPEMKREDFVNSKEGLSLSTFSLDYENANLLYANLGLRKLEDPPLFEEHMALRGYGFEKLEQPDEPAMGRKIMSESESAPFFVEAGESLALWLAFVAVKPTELDHNLFVRLVAQGESPEEEREISAFDGPPLSGSYGTESWQPGELILMRVELPVAENAPAGPTTLRLGWYDWRDGKRIEVSGIDGGQVELDGPAVGP